MIEHLLQGLCGVDAPAHFSAPPSPITGFKGGGFTTGGIKRIWEKVAGGEGRGETEREREAEGEGKGMGKRNSALVDGNRRQWGPGRSPGRKTNFMYLGVRKHFWLIGNVIYNKTNSNTMG